MTVEALVRLALLNLGYAVLGLGVLHALRGFPTWADVARLAGLAYLLGVAVFGVVWTQLLVVGVDLTGLRLVATLVVGAVAGAVAGTALGRARPARSVAGAALGDRVTLFVTAVGIALVGLLLEAFFRGARLQGLQAFDAWSFWVPKAKAIYLFGGLDDQTFTSLPGPSYPPLVPILDAAAFHALGGVDTVTFHLQFWFLLVGAAAAIAGVLLRHAPAWAVWPALLVVLVAPRFGQALLIPLADVLVDVLFAVAALLLALWLQDERRWRLGGAAVLLAGATLTKREGLLFAAIALAAVCLAAWTRRRARVVPILLAAGLVVATAVPWRLWYRAHDLTGEAPTGLGFGAGLDRALDSLRLSAKVLFETSLWSLVPFLLVGSIALALSFGERRLAVFFSTLVALTFLGGAWVTYSFPTIPITADEAANPIVRYTGSIVILAAAAMPLLVGSVWRAEEKGP